MNKNREVNVNFPDVIDQSNSEIDNEKNNSQVDKIGLNVEVKLSHSVDQLVSELKKEENGSLVDKSTSILNSQERGSPVGQIKSTLKNEERGSPVDQLKSTMKSEEHVDQSTLRLRTEEHGSQVDSGWAWAIMIGAFSNLVFIMTYLRASSLLFILFLEKYQESATKTAMVWMFGTALFALSNIVGPAVLFYRFQVRTLTITGAFINFISILVIAFAPNIYVIYVMMACLGFSHGLIAVPQMMLIGRYFHKRLGIATAFVSLGLSVATIAGPPLTQFVLDKYGLQGTIIILAGINMNCIPASMLFRPFTLKENNKQATQQENIIDDDSLDQEVKKNGKKEYDQSDLKGGHEKRSLIRSVSEEPSSRLKRTNERYPDDVFTKLSRNDDTSHSDIKTGLSKDNESMVSTLLDKLSFSSNVRYLSDIDLCNVDSFQEDNKYPKFGSTIEGLPLNDYSRTTDAERTSKIHLNTTSTKDTYREGDSKQTCLTKGDSKQTCLTKVRNWMSQSIYCQPLAILILIASGFGIHSQGFIAYMPAAGKENGLTNDQVPFLVTVLGVADLVSKIAVGFFADLGYIKRINIVLISEVICGIVVQFVRFFQGFGPMIALQIIIGTTMSAMHTFLAVIIVDVLGAEYIGHIMSGYFLVNGVVLSLDHVIAGSLKDLTGSFMTGYNYFGVLSLFSALLLFFEPLVAKYKPVKT